MPDSGSGGGSSRGAGRVLGGGFAADGESVDTGAEEVVLGVPPWADGLAAEAVWPLAAALSEEGPVANVRARRRGHGWTWCRGATTWRAGARRGVMTVQLGRGVRRTRSWVVGVISLLFVCGG